MPSSGGESEVRPLPEAPLMAAARLLADRGIYGLVWFDEALTVTARFGKLAAFAEIGIPLTETFWPLFGLEDEFQALRDTPGTVLNLPSVTVVRETEAGPRLNVAILWSEQDNSYLIVVSRANTKADLEAELSQHIRARLMAEAEVTQKSRELLRANRDLEEYASVISHDLKTPLRHLCHLAETLERDLGESLDAQTRGSIAKIKEQSQRMSRMLSALLEYSSIGRKEEAIETVNTRDFVESIVSSIPRPAGMSITLEGNFPSIVTLAAPLDLVLRNLISNAVRHHNKREGTIRISIDEGRNAYEISIADDGPGIEKRHLDAIFLPFRKLERSSDPESQGMGLSLVKRTVESIGGRIMVKSDPSHAPGTTFVVTWPKSAISKQVLE
jgi:signal transduction histidine kinase